MLLMSTIEGLDSVFDVIVAHYDTLIEGFREIWIKFSITEIVSSNLISAGNKFNNARLTVCIDVYFLYPTIRKTGICP